MMLSVVLLALSLTGLSPTTNLRLPFPAMANAAEVMPNSSPISANDGPANLREGQRLFHLGRHGEASGHLWRAISLHPKSDKSYQVQDALGIFLQCYSLQDKAAESMVFISTGMYMRGQDSGAQRYLDQALKVHGNAAATQLRRIFAMPDEPNKDRKATKKYRLMKELQDAVDISNPMNRQRRKKEMAEGDVNVMSEIRQKMENKPGGEQGEEKNDGDDTFWSKFKNDDTMATSFNSLSNDGLQKAHIKVQ